MVNLSKAQLMNTAWNFNPSSHHSHLIFSFGHLDAAEEHLAAAVPAALVRPPDLAEKEDITPLVS